MARILVIDDDDLVCEVVVRTLARAGHDVRQASDGVSGLRLSREAPADVVVTAKRMLGMSAAAVPGSKEISRVDPENW